MKEDVVEGIKDQISRVTVYGTLKELLEDRRLRDDSTNRRDHKLYVNTDNLLVSVPRELEKFEKAYLNLLHNSIKRINERDFSAVSKVVGIQELDPSKWNESEMVKYSKFEFEKWKKSLEIDRKKIDFLKRATDIQLQSLDRRRQLLDKQDALLNKLYKKEISIFPTTELDELDSKIERENTILKIESIRYSYDIHEFEISLLTYGVVAIFYLLKDTLFYRSILIWSNTVHDKEILKKLYTIVYTGIANLQIHLAKFLGSPKVQLIANPVEYKNPVEFIIRFAETMGNSTLSAFIFWYHDMGMLPFIEPIAASISNINKEISDYGYSNPMFYQLEHAFYEIKRGEEAKVKSQEASIKLQEAMRKVEELKRQRQQLRRRSDTLTSKPN
jgi:hypothetical protein